MWTYIRKEDLENFLNDYPHLSEILYEINLHETNDFIFLPRLFCINYKHPKLIVYKDDQCPKFTTVSFKFTGSLRSNQVPIVNNLLSRYETNKILNGIVKLPPGTGKTVMAIYLASKIGLKTMVIVDNDNLLKQWIKAFYEFTDLKESEIGIIKQKHFITDTPVSVALVQTLLSKMKSNMRKTFTAIDKAGYGFVIYDEVHATSSAPKFAKVSLLFRTRNILGLSATPFQIGFAKILMHNTIGDIIYETKEYELKPKYILHYYDSKLPEKYIYVLSKLPDYIKKKAYYNKIIAFNDEYYNIITQLVKQRFEEGHTIMVLCFTKIQVQTISDKLSAMGIENRKFYGDEKDDIEDNTRVLVTTYAFTGKGFDFQKLSSLILAANLSGKKSLIQVIGRVLRKHKEKLSPVVDDLVDLGYTSMFLPDVKAKLNIVKNEFDCHISHVRHNV